MAVHISDLEYSPGKFGYTRESSQQNIKWQKMTCEVLSSEAYKFYCSFDTTVLLKPFRTKLRLQYLYLYKH